MSDLEYSFIKAPLEALIKNNRQTQKISEREMTQLMGQIKNIEKAKNPMVALKQIKTIVKKLETFKGKLEKGRVQCDKYVKRSEMRLNRMEVSLT